MTYDEILKAFEEGRKVIEQAERFAKRGVEMSVGRIHRLYLNQETLADLKRELRSYNTKTGKWK